jgi:hypothetical protein
MNELMDLASVGLGVLYYLVYETRVIRTDRFTPSLYSVNAMMASWKP